MIPTVFETFEKHYDLTMLVGRSPTAEFKVCSRSVARTSKYFDTLLYGNFSEAKPENGNWVMKLPGTDCAAFRIMLSLIHGGHPEIPETPGEELYNLIKEIDYFDTYHMFEDHCSRWSSKVEFELRRKKIPSILHSRLFWAAWILGCKSEVSSALKEVFREVKRSEDGKCYIGDNTLLEFHPDIRFKLKELVGELHQHYIEKMATCYQKGFATILNFDRSDNKFLCKSRETRSEESKSICDKALFASLVWELQKTEKNIMNCPFQEKRLRHLSVTECADRLLSFKIQGVDACWWDHKACNPTDVLQAAVTKTKREAASIEILTDEHIAYLDNQQKIWGDAFREENFMWEP